MVYNHQGIGQPDWYGTPIWLAIAFNIADLFASTHVSEDCSKRHGFKFSGAN
jgi:hypothetical protein